jgi:hypothetical protein
MLGDNPTGKSHSRTEEVKVLSINSHLSLIEVCAYKGIIPWPFQVWSVGELSRLLCFGKKSSGKKLEMLELKMSMHT